MKGWKEEEFRNRDLMAPCGLYCGICGVYLATRDGNEKFKAIMGNLYGAKPEETECLGCMQPEPAKKIYGYCKTCTIRNCVKSREFYSCHQCGEWPCDRIEKFAFATGVRAMKRTIPVWRKKVAGRGETSRAALNGLDRSAHATTALCAASRFSGEPSVAGPAKNRSPMNWMGPYKASIDNRKGAPFCSAAVNQSFWGTYVLILGN